MILYVSFMHVAAIAFDRFISVVHPLHYETRMTPSTMSRIIAAIWIVAAAGSLPPYVGFIPTVVVRPQSCIVTLWPIFETVVEVMIYVVNSSIVVFVYSRVWSVAMRHGEAEERRQREQQRAFSVVPIPSPSVAIVPPPMEDSVDPANVNVHSQKLQSITENVTAIAATSSASAGSHADAQPGCWCRRPLPKKYRATRTILVILAAYVVLWFPYFLSRMLGVVVSDPSSLVIIQGFQTIASVVGGVNFSINIFIYTITNIDFRRAFKRLLRMRSAKVLPFHISTIAH